MPDPDHGHDVSAIANIAVVPSILEVVCQTAGMGFAAVARVTEERWIACVVRDEIQFGLLPGGELPLDTTICNEIRASREAVVIENVAEDPDFCDHHTPATYGFQSYISMPIILPDGSFFGTLCAIDPKPARLKAAGVAGMFRLFADMIAFHLDAHFRLAASEASLTDERKSSELREQFIAVLGHDLRNPLASIGAGATMLAKQPLNEKSRGILDHIHKSVGRMSSLIDDVLDFARGRLGGGILVDPKDSVALEDELLQVVEELRGSWPGRTILAEFHLPEPVRCDPARIGQLASNLIANALTHGAEDAPIRVQARSGHGAFEFSVANSGAAIPPQIAENLFKPFVRVSAKPSQQGLGLGLYIASEIAKAHHGTLTLSSNETETRFTLRMPTGR
jgi:signal transduction histidine kinase